MKNALMIAVALWGGNAAATMSNPPDPAVQRDGSAVRVCVSVHIAPGMWPPGSAAKANENLSGLLRGAIFGLVRQDGGNPYGMGGKHKIVRSSDYAVCRAPGPAKASLRYEYLPNGNPYKVLLSVHDEGSTVEREYIHDLSNEPHYAKVNTNQLYIGEDIRKRAAEIYDLVKKRLIEE